MRLLYDLFILTYGAGIRLAALLGNRKAQQWQAGRKDWEAQLQRGLRPAVGRAWFHCASLGEFEQGRPLIEAYKAAFPEHQILLTFFSPSGYEVRKHYPGADHVCYLPLDTARNAGRFVAIARPTNAFFIKYEFWLHHLAALHEERVPAYLVSGIFRKRQHFFRWYGGLFRGILFQFTHFFLQDEDSERLLRRAGVPSDRISITGDTRFDRVLQLASGARPDPLLEQWKRDRLILVAGSTWPEDERHLAEAIAACTSRDFAILIAPHEVDAASVEQLSKHLVARFGSESVERYSRLRSTGSRAHRFLILDTMGMLAASYRMAHVAYVGGGFGKGIHNVLEAAVWGCPVLFGPNHGKFKEATGLLRSGGGYSVDGAVNLKARLESYFGNDRSAQRDKDGANAAAFVADHAGATARIIDHLRNTA